MRIIISLALICFLTGCTQYITAQQANAISKACVDSGMQPKVKYEGFDNLKATGVECVAGPQ